VVAGLERSREMVQFMCCGFKILRNERANGYYDNRGYVKQTAAGFLELLMAQSAASAESKLLSLFLLRIGLTS